MRVRHLFSPTFSYHSLFSRLVHLNLGWVRGKDPSRLVHYEGGGSRTSSTDIVCPMYMRVPDMSRISRDSNETRPLILCEYVNFFTFPFLLLFEQSLLVYHYSQCLKMSQMLFIFWHFSPLDPSTNRVQHVKFNLYREVATNPKKKKKRLQFLLYTFTRISCSNTMQKFVDLPLLPNS